MNRVNPERRGSHHNQDPKFRSGATTRPQRRHFKEKEKRIQTLFDRLMLEIFQLMSILVRSSILLDFDFVSVVTVPS